MTKPPSSSTELVQAIGVEVDPELAVLSLTHRSYAFENGGLPTNERLEFLGDSVLGIIITDELYRKFPDRPEGQLAKMRSSVVSTRGLAEVARNIDLGSFVFLGNGETQTGGSDKDSILADTMEAVIGAVYLDKGLGEATTMVHRLFEPLIERSGGLGAGLDWKTSLQERTAELGLGTPAYRITESGPDHGKTFTAEAIVDGQAKGSGTGRTKKLAEQIAAETAWKALQ